MPAASVRAATTIDAKLAVVTIGFCGHKSAGSLNW
jgi:hypothetical protein